MAANQHTGAQGATTSAEPLGAHEGSCPDCDRVETKQVLASNAGRCDQCDASTGIDRIERADVVLTRASALLGTIMRGLTDADHAELHISLAHVRAELDHGMEEVENGILELRRQRRQAQAAPEPVDGARDSSEA